MNAKQVLSALALSATLAASADITGLTDLTDVLNLSTSVSGNDDINNAKTNGKGAFNLQEEATKDKIENDKDSNRLGLKVTDSNPLWVTCEFETNTVVNAYRIWNNTGVWAKPERAPKDFYLEGSSDGKTWTTLDSQSDQTGWSVGEARVFEFRNTTAYKFYRMTFTAHNGDTGGWLMIQELEYFCRPTDSLTVVGSPENYGEPSPSYGTSVVGTGDAVKATIATPIEIDEDTMVGCVGWKREALGDDDVWTELDSGEGTNVSFKHPGGEVRLTWNFEVSNRVVTAVHGAEGSGTVSGGGWFVQGGRATLKATPGAGYRFYRWKGDTDGVADTTAAEITVAADSPRTLTAFFVPEDSSNVLYVSTEGNDDNDGLTLANAKKTIAAAVAHFDKNENYDAYQEGRIVVAPGTYEQSNEFVLTNAIEVVGMTGKPEDVILRNTKDPQRVVSLRNRNALVSGVVIENGRGAYSLTWGGNVLIAGDGGTVSNCVIRSGRGIGTYGANVCVCSTNSLVTHCVISNGAVQVANDVFGIAIYVHSSNGGGRISNCLITQNATADNTYQKIENKQVQVVTLAGPAVMDNCTIVDNCHTGLSVVVHATAADAKIYNCVIAKNTTTEGTAASISWESNKGKFVNCVTDGDTPLNDTCKVGALDEMFKDPTDGRWLPKADGILKNAGTTDGIAVPAGDLSGRQRVRGDAIDVGCYEAYRSGMILIVH